MPSCSPQTSFPRPDLLQYMQDHVLILDGAMGTLLQAAGLRSGETPETWNLSHPDVIRSVHAAYYAASL